MEYEKLKKEFVSTAFRKMLKSVYPHRCANCGADEDIEYHHIVPLKLGGTNNFTNIAPLCHKCHKAAHCGQHMSHYAEYSHKGRKPKARIENSSEVFNAYINGEIGNRKCKELLGYSERTTILACPEFKHYIASKGIARVKNTVDIVGTCSELVDGVIVGSIVYSDGSIDYITYKDTGKNDTVYEKRGNTHENH